MKPYEDHVGLWAQELCEWVPDTIFDGHIHLGSPESMGPISAEREKEALTAFKSFTWQQACYYYDNLLSSKKIIGLIAFGLPLREVNIELANQYIIDLMKKEPMVKGFVLSGPKDTKRTIRNFEMALKADVRFFGVKPYFDFLGKSNYTTTMPEFIPNDLLEFMNSEKLIMMLHTSGLGMCDPDNQKFVKSAAQKYPNIKIVLAHMGRFLELRQFLEFMDSDVMDYPNIFLETSTVTLPEVYQRVFENKKLFSKLIFGTDNPFGTITGIEYMSKESGLPVFITKDDHIWSDRDVNAQFSVMRKSLTYNTYHVMKAVKDALASLDLSAEKIEEIKNMIFFENAQKGLFE